MRKPAGGDASGLFGETMDAWQAVRMTAVWPLVIGAGSFLATRLILLALGRRALGRYEAWVCASVGALAWGVTGMMAAVWQDTPAYWLAFTVGLGVLALVMVATAALLFMEDYRR